MSTSLDFDLKGIMPTLCQDGRWNVLTVLILHSNIRNRCYPGMDTIAAMATNGNKTRATRAKKWLDQHGAYDLVPYNKRVDDELECAKRQHVYQLTGSIHQCADPACACRDWSKHAYSYLHHEKKNADNPKILTVENKEQSNVLTVENFNRAKVLDGENITTPNVLTVENFNGENVSTSNISTGKHSDQKSGSRSRARAKVEYGYSVQWSLVEGAAGSVAYEDGEIIPVPKRGVVAKCAIEIFQSYLTALRELGRAPIGRDEKLWTKHQAAALALALARETPEAVLRFVYDQYRGSDTFWRTRNTPMTLQHVAENIRASRARKNTTTPPVGVINMAPRVPVEQEVDTWVRKS